MKKLIVVIAFVFFPMSVYSVYLLKRAEMPTRETVFPWRLTDILPVRKAAA